jgi:hypothetical protein
MHFGAWMDHPLEHLQSLSDSSLGFFHPFIITFIVYLLVLLLRFLGRLIQKVRTHSR